MNKIFYAILFLIIGLYACNKDKVTYEVFKSESKVIEDDSDFRISLDGSAIVNVNQPISFTISGKKDNVVLWTGEQGHEYNNKNRAPVTLESAGMSFTSANQWGGQANTLQVMASKNFSGLYTPAAIAAATWTNISSRANIPGNYNNAATASGNVNLTDFFTTASDKVHIAYKFISLDVAGGTKKTWTLTGFTLQYKMASAATQTLTLPDLSFQGVSVTASAPSQLWQISSTQLKIIGGGAGAATEDWAISRALQFGEDVETDKGQALILNTSGSTTKYSQTFNKPGKYRITFEHKNVAEVEAGITEFVVTVQ